MSIPFENPEHPSAPLPTDTLADSVLILIGMTVVQRLIGFVRAVLFCRWLDPEQLGIWDMAFSFLLLAAPLAVLAIPGAFGRYLEHYRQRGQLRLFIVRTSVVCAALGLASFAGVLFARQGLSNLIFGSNSQADLVALSAGCLLAIIAFNYLVELLTALRNVRLAALMQLVCSIAFAVLGLGLVWGWQCTAESVLIAYGCSCLIASALAVGMFIRKWRPHFDIPQMPHHVHARPHVRLMSRIVPYAGWILLGSVLINLFEVLDRYMIIHFSRFTPAEALDAIGNYHSSRIVPMLLVSIAVMLASMILPHMSHDWEAGRRREVASRLRLLFKLFGFALYVGAVAVLLASPLLFQIAFRDKYPEGQMVLPWTLVYCTWFGLSMFLQIYLLCAEKAYLSSAALFCGLLLNVPLNLILLPRLGLEGAVLATSAANALALGLICRFNGRLGFQMDDGAKLILVLPMLVCLGPWVALAAIAAVLLDTLWGDRLLTPDEKQILSQGIVEYKKRLGLDRLMEKHG